MKGPTYPGEMWVPSFAVREITCKSVINRVKGMPFDWSINPYRGCRHACVYCYARPTHEFLGLGTGEEFEEVIFAKVNAPDVVRQELARKSWRRDAVVIGTATDPYQQAESRYRITRGILEAFHAARNPLSITTKSPMVLRDLDLLADLAQYTAVTVSFTVTTMDEALWRAIEPTTSKPRKRLDAMRTLREHGVRSGVFLSPVLPGLTDDEAHLEAVIAAAAEHGADFVRSEVLRLGPGIDESYLPFLARFRPDLTARYASLYRGKYAPNRYVQEVHDRVHDLKARHGLQEDRYMPKERRPAPEPVSQLTLF